MPATVTQPFGKFLAERIPGVRLLGRGGDELYPDFELVMIDQFGLPDRESLNALVREYFVSRSIRLEFEETLVTGLFTDCGESFSFAIVKISTGLQVNFERV